MKRVFFLVVFLVSFIFGDTLDSLLFKVNLSRNDLGIEPKGYWNRYPLPEGIPYHLPAMEDLMREPLMVPVYLKTMVNACRIYLGEEKPGEGNSLYNLLYFLGVDRKVVSFRNYGANLLVPQIDGDTLLVALMSLHYMTSRQINSRSFGGSYDSLDFLEEYRKFKDEIPVSLSPIIGKLILNLLDAYKFYEISMRNIDEDLKSRIWRVRNFPETQPDGSLYHPEFDDFARLLDEHSLYYSALKIVSAVEQVYKELKKIEEVPVFHASLMTPLGRIEVGGGGSDTFRLSDSFIVIDMGGSDYYEGRIAASTLTSPISVAIDLEGDDRYVGDDATLGAGIAGVGVLLDGEGDDRYKASRYGVGMGVFGVGVLVDLRGDDEYSLEVAGEGCGYFGIGMLVDVEGNDNYYLCGNGQGDGEYGGIGVLVDAGGNDVYRAEPRSSVCDRGDYHSKFKINANNAQGFGGGRRGDGSDGHAWAGGLGALIDLEGDDQYLSGNWTLGVGYWYGIGFLYDGEGDDVYRSCYFTQGSGAHFSIGLFWDEKGNDKHILYETAGAAFGFGWDYVIALFIDEGGDDVYEASVISFGVAEIRSNAFFFELGGNDTYLVRKRTHAFGDAVWRIGYRVPNKLSPYLAFSRNLAFFLDLGGQDVYRGVDERVGDGKMWFKPEEGSEHYGYGNYGIGIDREGGFIKELEFFE